MQNNKTLLKKMKSFTRKTDIVEHCTVFASFVETTFPMFSVKECYTQKLVKLLRLEQNANENDIVLLLRTMEDTMEVFYPILQDTEHHTLMFCMEGYITEIKNIMKHCIDKKVWHKYEDITVEELKKITDQSELLSNAEIVNHFFNEEDEPEVEPDIRFHLEAECLDDEKEVIAEQIVNMINREFPNIDVEIKAA